MTKDESIAILDKCIKELENTTEDDFNKSLKEKGLSSKYYDEYSYEDNGFCLVLSHEYIPIMVNVTKIN